MLADPYTVVTQALRRMAKKHAYAELLAAVLLAFGNPALLQPA